MKASDGDGAALSGVVGESRSPGTKLDHGLAIVSVLCLAAAVFLAKATDSTLPATDSATHAALAMNATAFGLIPRLPLGQVINGGHWGVAGFNDHPFPFFYLSGWVMRYLGPDAWSAKLLPAAFSVGCVGLTIALGAALRSVSLGIVAGLILAFSRDFVIDGLNGHLDGAMMFFILFSFIAWVRGHPLLAGIMAGMGVWFKTPVALMLFPAVLLYHLFRLELRSHLLRILGSFVLALGVGGAVWGVTGFLGGWGLVRDYWVRQLWGTAALGRNAGQPFDALEFLEILRNRYMPWSFLLALSAGWNLITLRFRRPEFLLPAVAAFTVIVAISAIRFKYGHYFVPAYPFLALLAAQPLCLWVERHPAVFCRGLALIALVAVTTLLCSPIEPSPESFPAARRFMAVIQSYGTCQDQVAFVEGYQPYAEFDDYAHLINFYTGRQAIKTDCAGLGSAALAPEVKWVLISGPNYPSCLTPAVTARFPERVIDGNQVLLGERGLSAAGGGVDLTILGRELKAVTDCQAAPLPKDRYHGKRQGQ